MRFNTLANTVLISVLFTSLTACDKLQKNDGGSDNTNEVLRFSIIDKINNYEKDHGRRTGYIERLDISFKDGSLEKNSRIIKGEKQIDISEPNLIILAPEFEGIENEKIRGENLDVLSAKDREFNFNIPSNTNDNLLTIELKHDSIDIQGVTSENNNKYQTPLKKLGLNNASFPEGSTCYALSKVKPSFSYFSFSLESASTHKNLKDWAKDEKKYFKNVISVRNIKVGENDEYDAVYLETSDGASKWGSYRGAVNYNGAIYDAEYNLESGEFPNTTSSDINCYLINEIAANYIEQELKANFN